MNIKVICCFVACLLFSGCESSSKRAVNPQLEQIRNCAKRGKVAENATFKKTIADETVVHKREQAKYDAIIAHPEKYAEVVDLPPAAAAPAPVVFQPAGTLIDITDPNAPQTFKIDPVTGAKMLVNPQCKDGKCK